jgi:hypothetical protein
VQQHIRTLDDKSSGGGIGGVGSRRLRVEDQFRLHQIQQGTGQHPAGSEQRNDFEQQVHDAANQSTLVWMQQQLHGHPSGEAMRPSQTVRRRPDRRWLAGLCLVAWLPASGGAAQFITTEDECRGRQLLLQGVIEPGDHERLIEHLGDLVTGSDLPEVQDHDKLWTVMLDSPGGDLVEAMRMGRFLREALAITETGYRFTRRPDGVYDFQRSADTTCLDGDDRFAGCDRSLIPAECTGACLLVWLGGAQRHASEGRLGTHGLAAAGEEDLHAYLGEMGVPGNAISELLDSGPGDGWLSWAERQILSQRAEVVDVWLADCPAPLTGEESYESVASPSAAVRERLMDRAEAHRACRHQRLAAARVGLEATLRRRDANP